MENFYKHYIDVILTYLIKLNPNLVFDFLVFDYLFVSHRYYAPMTGNIIRDNLQ